MFWGKCELARTPSCLLEQCCSEYVQAAVGGGGPQSVPTETTGEEEATSGSFPFTTEQEVLIL